MRNYLSAHPECQPRGSIRFLRKHSPWAVGVSKDASQENAYHTYLLYHIQQIKSRYYQSNKITNWRNIRANWRTTSPAEPSVDFQGVIFWAQGNALPDYPVELKVIFLKFLCGLDLVRAAGPLFYGWVDVQYEQADFEVHIVVRCSALLLLLLPVHRCSKSYIYPVV